MASRFSPGDTVFGKDGRSYVVEAVDGPTVYCVTGNGAEMEFPDTTLFTETEWSAQEKRGRGEVSYTRLGRSRHYGKPATKIDPATASHLLTKIAHLSPSLLDFVAFQTAVRFLEENRDDDLIDQLSIVKSRKVFDEAPPETRVSLLSELVGAAPEALADAARLGDNLLRAMVEKGLAPHDEAFDEFQDRPRR